MNVNYDYSKLVACIHYWRRPRHPRMHTVPSVDTRDHSDVDQALFTADVFVLDIDVDIALASLE